MSLGLAIAAGAHGMALAIDAAERRDPLFRAKAEQAILKHLAHAPMFRASGEELVHIAKGMGAVPHDDRAFGSVFQQMERRGLTRCLRSDLPRKRGHGTSGGKLWGLCR